jgi:ATP-dependent Clp protease adaptor protein ClpS
VIEMLQKIFVFTLQEGRTVLIVCELAQAEFARDQVQGYGPDWRIDASKGSMTAIVEPAGSEA